MAQRNKPSGWWQLGAFLTFRWPRFPYLVGLAAATFCSIAMMVMAVLQPQTSWWAACLAVTLYFVVYEVCRVARGERRGA